MPVMKCATGGYKWGATGKCYPTREQAERQGRAIQMAKMKKKKKGGRRG